jgi:hypothetical protein
MRRSRSLRRVERCPVRGTVFAPDVALAPAAPPGFELGLVVRKLCARSPRGGHLPHDPERLGVLVRAFVAVAAAGAHASRPTTCKGSIVRRYAAAAPSTCGQTRTPIAGNPQRGYEVSPTPRGCSTAYLCECALAPISTSKRPSTRSLRRTRQRCLSARSCRGADAPRAGAAWSVCSAQQAGRSGASWRPTPTADPECSQFRPASIGCWAPVRLAGARP